MDTRYSPSTGTSYPFDIDYGDKLPADVVPVPIEDYQAALDVRSIGGTADFVKGRFVITQPAPLAFDLKAAPVMAAMRLQRDNVLNRIVGMGLGAIIGGNAKGGKAAAAARQALLDLPQHAAVLAATEAEDLDALRSAVRQVFDEVAASLPESMRSAFAGMVLP